MPNRYSEPTTNPRRWLLTVAAVAVIVASGAILVSRWRRPPQMGADSQVFRTVDALFTAVTARDENLIAQCEQRLHACRDDGKLPPKAAAYLDQVIAKSRAGRWESAAQSLYDFMLTQRRESAAR